MKKKWTKINIQNRINIQDSGVYIKTRKHKKKIKKKFNSVTIVKINKYDDE